MGNSGSSTASTNGITNGSLCTITRTDVDETLEKLNRKQEEWVKLSNDVKLSYINDALDKLLQSEKIVTEIVTAWAGDSLKKLKGEEKEFDVAINTFVIFRFVKRYLDELKQLYEVAFGTSKDIDALKGYKVETLENGQLAATVFPLTRFEKTIDPLSRAKGQLYFDPRTVKQPSDILPFDCSCPETTKGVCVVLGAGNIPTLTITDALFFLFQKNQVCFVKQHPIRNQLEYLMRFVFSKLYNDGYLESEFDKSPARSRQLVYNPYVTAVHMTGGKETHDSIVWGATREERYKRKVRNEPKLCNAVMTSELGCVTPCIVTPHSYTSKQLKHQADVMLTSKCYNGGAACMGLQVIVLSKNWLQRDEFLTNIEVMIRNTYTPNAFYPGSRDRWNGFRTAYPTESRIIEGLSTEESGKDDELHLPLLLVNVDVDLTTDDGLRRAKREYAFRKEAFCPVLVIATVSSKNNDSVDAFMKEAVTLCNDCIYGTLSMSIIVPDTESKSPHVESAIQNLRYGYIATNTFPLPYFVSRTVWGGYQRTETLDNVESGIGYFCNTSMFRNVDKCVLRTPIIDELGHLALSRKSYKDLIDLLSASKKFAINPDLFTLLNALRALFFPRSKTLPIVTFVLTFGGILLFLKLVSAT